MSPDEAAAAYRLWEAAAAAAPRLGSGSAAPALRAALDPHARGTQAERTVALTWAVRHLLVSDRRTAAPWFRELDAAFEGLFAACSGAIGPTIRTGGKYDGRKRPVGRPSKQQEATA